MHRGRQRSVAAAFALALTAGAPSAWAFHAGDLFDKPPGAGGADGIFYTGAPQEHGWKCDLCHQSPPGKISLELDITPDLLTTSQYTPGTTYDITVTMLGEHAGLTSTHSNYNSLVVKVIDQNSGAAAGFLSGFAPEDFYQDFSMSTIASAGKKPNVTQWSFKWISPGPMDGPDGGPPGPVGFYIAAVDGNGADIGPSGTLTDPFNDDFITASLTFTEAGAKTGKLERHSPFPMGPQAAPNPGAPWAPGRHGTLACMIGLALVGVAQRRRRRS